MMTVNYNDSKEELGSDKVIDLKKLFSEILHLPSSEISSAINSETCSQWDSIAHIDIIIALEKITGKNIGPEKVSELVSYAVIVLYLEKLGFVLRK